MSFHEHILIVHLIACAAVYVQATTHSKIPASEIQSIVDDHVQHLTYQQKIDKATEKMQYTAQHGVPQISEEIYQALSSFKPEHILQAAYTANITSECADAMLFILESPLPAGLPNYFTSWKLKFFDSWGKPTDGLLLGHFKWPGMYDECKNITAMPPANNTYLKEELQTKYCSMYMPVVKNLITIQLGLCSPKQCTDKDLTTLWNSALGKVLPGGAKCQNLDYVMDGGRVTALVFVFILIGICVIATMADGVIQIMENWNRPDESGNNEETTPLLSGGGNSSAKTTKPQEHSLPVRTLLAFSIYTNTVKLMNTNQPPGTITCINGIRFFSMTWVILGHTLLFLNFSLMENTTFVQEVIGRFSSQAIIQAPFSVDSFFVLSGLLVGYLFMRDFKKRQIQVQDFFMALPLMYLHRYVRLTPAYGLMILIWTSLLWFAWDGPNWPNWPSGPQHTPDQKCVDHWYLNILYVNNIFKVNEACAGWGWYLANDTQFFLIAPFLVYLFYLSLPIGIGATIATIIGSNIAAIAVSDGQRAPFIGIGAIGGSAKFNFTPEVKPEYPLYFVPWTRYQSYGVGILAGLIIWKLKDMDFKLSKVHNAIASLALWGLAAGLCLTVVYAPYNAAKGWHTVYLPENDLYNGLSRTTWSIGVSLVIILCYMGNGGWINEFLSWRGFVPLSRLTYCAYLIHIPILEMLAGAKRHGKYYNNVELGLDVLLIITLAYFFAYLFSMLFEAPFINLDKLFLTPHSIKGDKKGKTDTRSEGGTMYQSAANSSGSIQQSVNPQHHFQPIASAPNDEPNVTVYSPPGSVPRDNGAFSPTQGDGGDLPPKYQEHV